MLPAQVRGKKIGGLIEFIVDTGSSVSFIGTVDCFRLNIPVTSFPLAEPKHLVVGTESLELRELGKIVLGIMVDEKLERIEMNSFKAAKGLRGKESTPSIFGLDFLKANNFYLYANPAKNVAYMSNED